MKFPTRSYFPLATISLLIGGVMALPLGYLFLRALGAERSFLQYLLRPAIGQVLGNTLLLMGIVTLLAIVIGTTLAFLLTRTDLPGRKVLLPLTLLPIAMPSFLGAFALLGAIGPRGWLQQLLAPLGVERLPTLYGLSGAVLVLTLFTYPYVLLSVRSALLSLNSQLEEAAQTLGRGQFEVFRTVVLPSLRPAMLSGGLLSALYVISDFGAVAMLQYNTLTRAIYLQYRAMFDRSGAAMLALILIGIVLIVLWLQARWSRSLAGEQAKARHIQLKRWALGWWKIPALFFVLLLVLIGVLSPVVTLLYWLYQGWSSTGWQSWPWQPILNSLGVALVTALIAVVLAFPPALLSIRYPGKLTTLIEKLLWLGHGLPGIVIALALVFVGANFLPWIYQTFVILVFAYLMRYLPHSLSTLRNNLAQLNPNWEASARSLGRSRLAVLRTLFLPLLRPGIGHGFALVFLAVLRELPATLLLAPTGFATLATRLWHASEEALYAQAAWPGLWLMLISALALGLLLRESDHNWKSTDV